jgi:DNA helicase-2/ATP-dependent DNA helicase PcrA
VGTLHSICFRALEYPELTIKHVKEWNELNPHLELSVSTSDVDDLGEPSGQCDGDACRNAMEICRAKRLPFELWDPDAQGFFRAWSAWKERCGYMDFTDLLETCLNYMDTAPDDPAVIIGDEAQDWSKLALDLLMQWGQQCQKVILAADGNQAIFSWAGADAADFLSLPVKPENRFVLRQSYRLPRIVHERAQAWIGQASVREDADFSPRKDSAGNVVDGFFEEVDESLLEGLEELMERVAEMAEKKTVMVLAATCYHVSKYVQVLREMAVPFHNANRTKEKYWNPLDHDGFADRVRAFLAASQDRLWTKHEASLWMETVRADGAFVHGGKKKVESWKDCREVVGGPDLWGVCVPEFCDRLDDMIGNLTGYHGKPDPIAALQAWLDVCLPDLEDKLLYAARVVKKRGPDALDEKPRITVGTIHSVKGAEADVVVLFPDLSPSGHRQWEGTAAERDDVIRTFYVGLTRAREGVILCSPSTPRHVEGL